VQNLLSLAEISSDQKLLVAVVFSDLFKACRAEKDAQLFGWAVYEPGTRQMRFHIAMHPCYLQIIEVARLVLGYFPCLLELVKRQAVVVLALGGLGKADLHVDFEFLHSLEDLSLVDGACGRGGGVEEGKIIAGLTLMGGCCVVFVLDEF